MQSNLCPCQSGKNYNECCQPYHKNFNAPTAEALMRSRYSAYAKGLTEYIIATAHPKQLLNRPNYKKEIELFAKNTLFEGLEVLKVEEGPEMSFVTFLAHLRQGQQDISFKEKSRFIKENEKWLYIDGIIDPKE